MQKVSDFIDIEAPCEEVFEAIAGIDRRMQLSPLWGMNVLLGVSPDYPRPGSSYRVRVLKDVPFGIAGPGAGAVHGALAGLGQVFMWKMGHDTLNTPAEAPLPVVEEPAPQKSVVEAEQEYFVQEWDPPHRLSYALDADCDTIITWKLQSIPRGTRLSYEEVFCQENTGGKDFLPTVRHVIHEWLLNIKRYGELRGTRGKLILKRLLDRFFLKLRPDQRRTVLLILFMQGIAVVTFIFAAVGLGIAGWVVK
jgi:hypothetical protein